MPNFIFLTFLFLKILDGGPTPISINAQSVRPTIRKSDRPLIRVEISNQGVQPVYIARKPNFNRRAGLAGFSCSSEGWRLEGADAWLVQPREDDLDRFIRDSWVVLDPDRSYVATFDLGALPAGIKNGPHEFECEYYDSILDRLSDKNRKVVLSKLDGTIVTHQTFEFTVNISE